jgi:hypothetical protein
MSSSWLNQTLLLGLASVTFIILIGLPLFIKHHREKQKRYHRNAELRQSVLQFRLSKMLAFIGIRLDDYLTRIPYDAIQRHITNCAACPNIPTCDHCLRDGRFVSDMNFCPNYQSLMAYSRIMPSVE